MSSREALGKIEQLVFDDNKIVSYKFLSREFSLHVNQAKQVLNQFITDYFSKGENDLTVCYALSGLQKYNGHKIHKVTVVPKHQLEKVKETFLLLSSVHVYSIQKATNLNDCILFASDSALTKPLEDSSKFSAIRHSSITIQSDRIVKNVVPTDSKETRCVENKIPPKFETKASNPIKKANSLFTTWQKKDDAKKAASNESASKDDKSDYLPSTDTQKDNGLRQKHSSKQNSVESSKVQVKKNSNQIATLFSKQAEKASQRPCVKAPSPVKCQPVKTASLPSTRKSNDAQEIVSSKLKEKTKNKRVKKTKLHDLSDSGSDNEWKKPRKTKHRRIIMAETDSDSENEEERDKTQRNLLEMESPVKLNKSMKNEDEEDDDEDDLIPPTPPVQASNGKCKKLKFVSKTFEDEEGFLVTQRVKEYVSVSEDSESEPVHIKDDKSLKTPLKSEPKLNFANKKQASLTSFFKRK